MLLNMGLLSNIYDMAMLKKRERKNGMPKKHDPK